MDLSELLNSPIRQSIVKSTSGKLGMDENQFTQAVKMALPTILAGLNKNAQSPEGAQSLNNALEDSRHDGSLLDNLTSMLQNNSDDITADGNGILGHIFGDRKSVIEQGISRKTGASTGQIGSLLSMLAPIVMAYLGKKKQQTNTGAGGLSDMLGSILGGGQQQTQQQSGGGFMDMITGALDKDGDGNMLDDLMGMLGNRK